MWRAVMGTYTCRGTGSTEVGWGGGRSVLGGAFLDEETPDLSLQGGVGVGQVDRGHSVGKGRGTGSETACEESRQQLMLLELELPVAGGGGRGLGHRGRRVRGLRWEPLQADCPSASRRACWRPVQAGEEGLRPGGGIQRRAPI